MRLSSSGLANALSSGLSGFLNSGQRFSRASQAILDNTFGALNGGEAEAETEASNSSGASLSGNGTQGSVIIESSLIDRINEINGTEQPEMTIEEATVEMIKAGTTYNASARIIRTQTSMLDALFRAVA